MVIHNDNGHGSLLTELQGNAIEEALGWKGAESRLRSPLFQGDDIQNRQRRHSANGVS